MLARTDGPRKCSSLARCLGPPAARIIPAPEAQEREGVMRLRTITMAAAGALALGLAQGAGAAEIRVVISEYSDATGPLFEEIVADFEAANPDIDVHLEVVAWDVLFQKLTTDIAGGQPPDVSIIGTRWLVDFVQEGIAEPLDAHLGDELRGRFIETFLDPSVIDGQTWGLPVAASARAMYYNRDLLEQAGVEPPDSWAELKEAAAAVSALADDVYGFGLQGKEIETDAYWYYAPWSHGGDLFEDGRSAIASDAAVMAALLYKDLIDSGVTQPGVTGYNREDLQDLFKRGRLGMMLTGPWLRGMLASDAPDVDYGVTLIPEGTTRATYGVTDSIIMFSGSRNKDEAWQFLEHAFQHEWRREFTLREGFLPVFTSVAEDPHFADDPQLAAFTDMLPYARFAPLIPNWEEMADTTIVALQRIYLGEAEAKDALGEAAATIDRLLGN
jgi:multiple sugar transport system substrate-binding protein